MNTLNIKQLIREEVRKQILKRNEKSINELLGISKFKTGDIVQIKAPAGERADKDGYELASRKISKKYPPKKIDGKMNYYVTSHKASSTGDYSDDERQGDTYGAKWVPEDQIIKAHPVVAARLNVNL